MFVHTAKTVPKVNVISGILKVLLKLYLSICPKQMAFKENVLRILHSTSAVICLTQISKVVHPNHFGNKT
jgi:hypothetical protein